MRLVLGYGFFKPFTERRVEDGTRAAASNHADMTGLDGFQPRMGKQTGQWFSALGGTM